MRRNACWLLAALLCVATASAQTPTGGPRAQISLTLPGDRQPAAAPAVPARTDNVRPETLVTFDYRRAELRWINQRWQLVADGVWLKDFGYRQADAREALRVIQNLRLTQRGTVGTPVPVMEYWLADGQAPRTFTAAGHIQPLDVATLRVDQVQGQWSVRDNHHVLFTFGPHRDDADQALALINRYGFTHVGSIGLSPPTMLYFLAGESGLSRTHFLKAGETRTGAATKGPSAEPDGPKPAAMPSPAAFATGRQEVADAAGKVGPASVPERIPFDYRQVQVRHDQNDWKLAYGSHVFANFGADHQAAEQALGLFHYYRFTEQFLIGRPVPTFAYFLVAGQAPRGLKFGFPAEAFSPEAVVVRQVASQWMVCEGDRPLVNFGDQQADARQLAQAIQRYRFDHLCRLGNGPGRSLTFLVRAR
jgi:hypothetical protein